MAVPHARIGVQVVQKPDKRFGVVSSLTGEYHDVEACTLAFNSAGWGYLRFSSSAAAIWVKNLFKLKVYDNTNGDRTIMDTNTGEQYEVTKYASTAVTKMPALLVNGKNM
eukprot:7673255-Lingulodinium_polyedra.AAC.1